MRRRRQTACLTMRHLFKQSAKLRLGEGSTEKEERDRDWPKLRKKRKIRATWDPLGGKPSTGAV